MQAVHPGPDQLSEFALGKLLPDQIDAIEEHLSGCAPCCETLRQCQQDTFVALVGAMGASPDGLGATLTQAPGTTPTVGGPRAFEVPIELTNHPRYRVLELLGSGGMGAVYRGEHRLMQRSVALKIINPRLVASEASVDRFRREIQAAARLQHANIVAAFDAEQAGDVHFFVMEYVAGKDLQRVLDERGPLPITEACAYVRQAALGLQHAHENGMVHRDIKPHNLVVVAGRGDAMTGAQVKILDFGLASLTNAEGLTAEIETANEADSSLTHVGALMGTPDYMAPEQARDAHAADIRADIYSLGCTLYTLLTGAVPFPGGTAMDKIKAHAEQSPRPIVEMRKDIPPDLARVLDRMLAKDPARRFQTPADVAAALAPFISDVAASNRRRARRRLVALAFATAAVILLSIVHIATDKGQLKVESKVDDVQIVVSKDGKEVEVIDLTSGTAVKRLPSGEYSVRLKGERSDVILNRDGFTIARGKEEVVRVEEVVKAPVAQAAKPRRQLTPTDKITPAHRKAIDKGLEYLVKSQSSIGFWEAVGGQYRVPMTALSGMALLMDGSTIDSGPYAESIRKAVDWLMAQSRAGGLLVGADDSHYFFGHGYAMMFLATVYSQLEEGERRATLHKLLTKAVEFTASGTTSRGGWGYVLAKDGGDFDESATTIVQLQALRAARNAGIAVPRGLLDASFLRKCTGPNGGVVYSITYADRSERPPLTAAALSASEFDSDLAKKWWKACQKELPLSNRKRLGHDEFTHYYYAQAIYQLGENGFVRLFPESKPDERLTWSKYKDAMFDGMIAQQGPDGGWNGPLLGKAYGTACYLTILQLDNAAVPIYQR
ncbi:MAG TPA: protein kinase [Gemmataceae bacterium]|jgi:predicted Ser/Thr protein kinase|nr:protein kinase [Gemmataceae bacterium]